MHAINHTKGAPHEDNRNVLEESARIARGKISDLADLNADDFDALVVPGGFGAAKNLSNWALKGIIIGSFES
jgi:enhancing lycopene biosynthesis protein 2